MSEEEESRVYTINLSKVIISPKIRRAKRAVNMIKEFAFRHMKAEEVKIDEGLNREIWETSIRNPPRRIRVKMTKDADGIVTVGPYAEEAKKEEVAEAKPAEVAVPAAQPAVAEAAKPEVVPKVVEPEAKAEAVEVKEPEVVEEKGREEEPPVEEEKVVLSEEEIAEMIEEEMRGEAGKPEAKTEKKGSGRKKSKADEAD